MVHHTTHKALFALLASAVVLNGSAHADDLNLPDLGSPADAILSASNEKRLGHAIMRDIRRSGKVVEDPIRNEYVNEIGNRIAAQTNEGEHEFTFFIIDDPRVNAFALPGGYIGIHSGLLEATRSEDELAGVLAHEIAHVTQRHIARAIHANSRQSILSTAIMLGALVAGVASGNSDVVQAGTMVAQGAAMQQQINFTRSNEYEADRIGIASLADAGFDPYGMASFFDVLGRQNLRRPDERTPEFLRTHPVTTARVAEARNRARSYDLVRSDDSIGYQIARIRTVVTRFNTSKEAVAYFERRTYANQNDAERYGRALAYYRDKSFFKALDVFEILLEKDPKIIPYHIALGNTLVSLRKYDKASDVFEHALGLFPRNVPLVVAYAERLLELDKPDYAHTLLLDLLNNVPPTPDQVHLIARAASAAGESAESYYYLSEHRFMLGDLDGGIGFLQRALNVPEIEEIQRIRFEARIDFIREFMSEEQLRRLRRSQPSSKSARNL
jgi:predicted Zn-dependent protease